MIVPVKHWCDMSLLETLARKAISVIRFVICEVDTGHDFDEDGYHFDGRYWCSRCKHYVQHTPKEST